jgi:charged multivesicular body protein 6
MSKLQYRKLKHVCFLYVLQVGNAALKKMHDILSLEDVERIMDETREGIEKQNEIDELLSGGLSQEDEADVMAELDQILAQGDVAKLPDVPSHELPEEEEREREREKERKRRRKEEQKEQREAVAAT